MLNTIDTISVVVSVIVNLAVANSMLRLTLRGQIVLAVFAGIWVGLAIAAANAGLLAFAPDQPVPYIAIFFAVPLIASMTAWLVSTRFRQALLGIPVAALLGVNSMRVLGGLFIVLAAAGHLSGPFPYIAGLGDVFTGIAAAILAANIVRGQSVSAHRIRSWNLFGAADLFIAVFLGMTSSPGTLQLFHVGVGSEAMQHFPFSIVPTVLVPFYLITHGIVAAQLSAQRKGSEIGEERAALP